MKIIGTYGDSNYKIYNDHYRHLQGTFTTSYDLKTIKDLGTVTSSIKKFGFPPYIDDDQLYDLKISTLQNGDYILSMEQRIFKPSQFYLVYGPYMSGYGTERQYVANSIFIAGMSKNGDLKWVSGIPKNQIEEQNSRFISHFFFVQDNRFFVVYNSSNKISKPFNPINSGQFEIIISEFDAMGMSKTYRLNNPFNGVACINKSIYSGENKSLYLIVSSLATYTSYNYIKLANIDMRNLGK